MLKLSFVSWTSTVIANLNKMGGGSRRIRFFSHSGYSGAGPWMSVLHQHRSGNQKLILLILLSLQLESILWC